MNKIVILDFGSQYTQLIARRIRELEVYCEIFAFNKLPDFSDCGGIILSGSPSSVHDSGGPRVDFEAFPNVPILGICYGAQLMADIFGGKVVKSNHREYGRAQLNHVVEDSALLEGIALNNQVWMSHADTIFELPNHSRIIASTDDVKIAGFEFQDKRMCAIQFHPEVYHTDNGLEVLRNFVFGICGMTSNWSPGNFVDQAVKEIRDEVGETSKVLLGLSGGVDSSVAALLLDKAIGDRLHCFFIDNGLLRKNEFEDVLESYKNLGLNIIGIDAKEEFYSELSGVSDPEKKRKTIGRVFVEVFEKEAKKVNGIDYLAQGTIYPDIIESVSVSGPSVSIKSHHNVGGLPDKLSLKVIEPLKMLFKDEVRRVGRELELPPNILNRHPFPGPGLAIRILGDITPEKVNLLQQADHIYTSILKRTGWYDRIWQAGAILLPVHSVGVMGDERTYEKVVALRAVQSTDGMTAEWSPIPTEILGEISSAIINRVNGINRVVYDISTKPPATIEWE